MRLFIAVPVGPVRPRIGEILDDLAKAGADCKWVRPENMHLTLQFLGEMPEAQVPGVEAALKAACKDRAKFQLSFDSIGAFPNPQNPRVFWVGIKEGADQLKELAKALAGNLKAHGVGLQDEEREFKAHLTIGRMRGSKNIHRLQEQLAEWPSEKLALPMVPVEKLVLFQSQLKSSGPVYTELRSQALA